jgi:hypothetical protein
MGERDGGSELILKAIQLACVCAGMDYWSRKDPETARGLRRAAAKHRADCKSALAEFIEREGLVPHGVRPPSFE